MVARDGLSGEARSRSRVLLESGVAVWRWFKAGKNAEEAPLTGAPAQARMKSYSAMSGYVYQYVFATRRSSDLDRRPGVEYAFMVSYDRKTQHRIWVFVSDDAIAGWIADQGRSLTNSERYGVAKMALRNAFDQRVPGQIHNPIAPDADEVRTILDELGV